MNYSNIKQILGTVAISFGLVACSGGSSSTPSTESAPQGTTTQNSTSASGLSIPKSQQQQGTTSSYQNVIVNSGGTQNIASNGGDCAPVSAGGTQVSVISGSNISNVNMKSSSSSFYECELMETGEKISLNGQKVCMSQEACVGKLSQYDAVRAVESPCRDAVALSDSEVASLLAK